ncbi:hypothetical protein BK816_07265 [Boudabousia tangfeifanii]|uniref:Uncharacterized protein n=1 Tax=Boudabousia tangfeifanii TaxID=1912795 RepID=A0A1D9MLD6_9ACTO|nr:hypothetical protein BK816_07265 [Boudabousia tangfeifanii]
MWGSPLRIELGFDPQKRPFGCHPRYEKDGHEEHDPSAPDVGVVVFVFIHARLAVLRMSPKNLFCFWW